MLIRHSRNAVVAASHLGATIVEGLLTGVFIGAAAVLIRARLLNGGRDRLNRRRRFLDVRRVTYGRLLSCCDSQADAFGSLVAARAAHEKVRVEREVAFGAMREAVMQAGQLGDVVGQSTDSAEPDSAELTDSQQLLRGTDGLLETLRGDGGPESVRAVEGVVHFMKAVENVEPLARESEQASERADQGMKELRSIVVEIEILGARRVLIQALKLLEAVSGAKSYPERLGATAAARKHFVEAADEDVASSRPRLVQVS